MDRPSQKSESAQRSGTVQSVERALILLELLGRKPKAIASRICRCVRAIAVDRAQGAHDPREAAFRPVRWLGSTFSQQRNFVAPSLPFLRRLRDQMRETANLGVTIDGRVVVAPHSTDTLVFRFGAIVTITIVSRLSAPGFSIEVMTLAAPLARATRLPPCCRPILTFCCTRSQSDGAAAPAASLSRSGQTVAPDADGANPCQRGNHRSRLRRGGGPPHALGQSPGPRCGPGELPLQ